MCTSKNDNIVRNKAEVSESRERSQKLITRCENVAQIKLNTRRNECGYCRVNEIERKAMKSEHRVDQEGNGIRQKQRSRKECQKKWGKVDEKAVHKNCHHGVVEQRLYYLQ